MFKINKVKDWLISPRGTWNYLQMLLIFPTMFSIVREINSILFKFILASPLGLYFKSLF